MKSQFAIFLIASLFIAVAVLSYGTKVAADITQADPVLIDQPGVKIVLGPKNGADPAAAPKEYMLEAQRVINRRLDQLQPGTFDITVKHSQLEVHLPDQADLPAIIDIITRPGKVEFIHGGPDIPPVGQELETGPAAPAEGKRYQTLFRGRDIVAVHLPDSGDIFYQIILHPATAGRMTDFMENNAGDYICLVIDREMINCSKIYYWSGQSLDILPNIGGATPLTLADLAIFLNSGPLPAPLEVVTE
jgi:preprotein translocase subunit SecD